MSLTQSLQDLMLPSLHIQRYRELQQRLEKTSDTISQHTFDRAVLKASVTDLQQYFQTQILRLDLDEIEMEFRQQVQSIQVEINKQLRLLNMDAMFLQAAKQSSTLEQRVQQMRDRCSLLHRYCDAILAKTR